MSITFFLLKSCPRCEGDLVASRDHFGPYVKCLQCARFWDERNRPRGRHPGVPAWLSQGELELTGR